MKKTEATYTAKHVKSQRKKSSGKVITPQGVSSPAASIRSLGNISKDTSQDSRQDGSIDFQIPGSGPLLGSEEMRKYLSGSQATVQVTTWNMGSLPLPKEHELRKLFYHDEDESLKKVDIHVISIQECWPDSDAWELELQVCLGPGYALFHSLSFGTLHISIFFRRDLLWFTTEPSDWTMSVRSGRLFKTKGCAGIAFGFFGSKFVFVNSHLSAGDESDRENQRIDELHKILQSYQKPSGKLNGSDAIFLSGDLNFRICRMTREDILDSLRRNRLDNVLENDQLILLLKRPPDTLPKGLQGFMEAATITFRPTYKYDLGTDKFDSSNKKRAPAYTDRIIYKCKNMQNENPTVVCLAYEAVTSLRLSDHKPVYSIFSVHIKPGFDTLPLSGARFKKDLFTRAAQKRAKFLLDRRKKLASTVCNLS
ncbi:unnamed protein product [Allacma fusca]|uniref:Inositol polyphosphate-related phosphatase domain-containing protein n=1 Tax=Allacma fusca TaxID=39272 RepID=A0A8J2KUC2_9HEXA|nr:unnamed protein product [Allacma fusca]